MSYVRSGLWTTHTVLARRSFYALICASLLACSLLAARMHLTRTPAFVFLGWNLFLAWVPYLCSLYAESLERRRPGGWWRLLLPGALWLIFFPNAPYIVTDLIHLRWAPERTVWYDIGMVAAFAWSGIFLAVASLQIMQTLVEGYLGRLAGWLFALIALGLCGLGVYIGRFLRWNSWDVLVSPRLLAADILERALHINAVGITFIFASLLLVCYLTYLPALRQPAWRKA